MYIRDIYRIIKLNVLPNGMRQTVDEKFFRTKWCLLAIGISTPRQRKLNVAVVLCNIDQ